MKALSRIGRHVKTFTFRMFHTPDALLPPMMCPETGSEKKFTYKPQMQDPHIGPAKDKAPKYGSWEMQDLLVKQYPPLFHAATNVPAFVAAFSELNNLTHLKISCPGFEDVPRNCRSVVDYALISLRIAVERSPLYTLSSLSLHPIHCGGLIYLYPMRGFGSTALSAKRWAQIRCLSICMESIPLSLASPRVCNQSLEHLRMLHVYLHTLSSSLTRLFFRWKGARGPSPLSLNREPCMLPLYVYEESGMHPSMRGQLCGPLPLRFLRLRRMELGNAVMDSSQMTDFILKHRRTLRELNFEDVKLRERDWDDTLALFTQVTDRDFWTRTEQVMDVPIMLSPVNCEPRIMAPLLEEVDNAIEEVNHNGRSAHALSRWLRRSGRTLRKIPAGKESFFEQDRLKRLLRMSAWK